MNQNIITPVAIPQQLLGPDPYQNGAALWFFKKYWWISIPVALAIGGRVLERKRKNTLTAYNVLEDISTIAAPGLGVMGVIALVRQEYSDALTHGAEIVPQAVEGYNNEYRRQ